jgi:hypothetical protein
MSVLTITNGARVVGGKSLESYLRAELTAFQNGGPAGAALLGPVLGGGGSYEVVIKDGVPTATSGTRVTINPTETNIATAVDLTGLREFAESTLFELTNATNAQAFRALDNGLGQGKPVRAYGREKADLESKASWNVSTILQQRAGYQPSSWGAAQIKACGGCKDAAQFSLSFRTQSHEGTAPKTSAASLPSEQYYAFNAAYTVGGTRGAFDAQFHSITVGGKKIALEKLKAGVRQSPTINRMNLMSVVFYHVVTDVLRSPPATLKLDVKWRSSVTDYEFTDTMKYIARDAGDALKTEVIRVLPKALAS